jgi:hypothetical protein
MVNDGTETLNIKGGTMVRQDNRYSIYLFSNYDNALHFSETDRKLLVINSPDSFMGFNGERYTDIENPRSKAWYHYVWDWLRGDGQFAGKPPGYNEIYTYLLSRDVSHFHRGQLPVVTNAYTDMVRASKPEWEAKLIDDIETDSGAFEYAAVTVKDIQAFMGVKPTGSNKITPVLKKNGLVKGYGQKWVDGRNRQVKFWTKHREVQSLSGSDQYDWYIQHSNQGRLQNG